MLLDERYKVLNGDCIELSKKVPDQCVGLTIFSPPFAELYVYNNDPRDMGNCKNYEQFFDHFSFLTPELFRMTIPGRLVAVHCMDLPIQKGKEGFIGLRDFSGLLIDHFQSHGFIYHSRVTIWKDPVVEMQRTKALGLLHKQIKKDATFSRVGIPDYILVFRHPGESTHPITHQDKDPAKPNYLPVDLWQKYASPVWYDINYSNTLNKNGAKADDDEKHICPLQLETIDRCIHLWSNEDDIVFDPFGGIGSTGYQALKRNRRSISFELKQSYFELNEANHKAAVNQSSQFQMF